MTDIERRLRAICLKLPDTTVAMTWGKPHFRVNDRIFAGCGEEGGVPVIGFKLEMEHAAALVKKPGVWPAPYVGSQGWVSMDARKVRDWKNVEAYVLESYRLIAKKTTLRKLDGPKKKGVGAKKVKATASTKKARTSAPRARARSATKRAPAKSATPQRTRRSTRITSKKK